MERQKTERRDRLTPHLSRYLFVELAPALPAESQLPGAASSEQFRPRGSIPTGKSAYWLALMS
jgi:hypothetical protein